jgi:hypothetical protein
MFLLNRGKECLVGRRRMGSREWRARKGSPVAGGASPPVAEDERGRKERDAREKKPRLQRPSCVGFKGGRTMWKGKEGERGEKVGKGGGRAGGREGKKSFPPALPGLPELKGRKNVPHYSQQAERKERRHVTREKTPRYRALPKRYF